MQSPGKFQNVELPVVLFPKELWTVLPSWYFSVIICILYYQPGKLTWPLVFSIFGVWSNELGQPRGWPQSPASQINWYCINQSPHPKSPGGSKPTGKQREDITSDWRLPLRDQGQRLYLSFQTIFSQTMTERKTHSTTGEESRYLMDLSNSLTSPSTWCYFILELPAQKQL